MTPGTEQRKLAAIMFTDMVGYSALAQRNEALALELLGEQQRLLRPLFPKFNGREIKSTGDGFLVEFASALEAAQCAIEIQKAVAAHNATESPERHLHLRIGLHLGDVVLREADMFGDGVNIAARIEPLAEAGGICLSGPVHDQVANKLGVALVKLGAPELKNIQTPVDVYRVVLPWHGSGPAARPSTTKPRRPPTARTMLLAGTMGLILLGLVWVVMHQRGATRSSRGPASRITSLAVKPLDDYSGDTNQAYLSDGMTEALCSALGNISALRVPGRSSVMRFKGGQKSIQEMARELKVDAMVEGSVQRAGNRILVTAQLIEAATDRHLWSTNFERDLSDFFKVQSEVARAIAAEVRVRLTPEDQARLVRARTARPETIEAYLLGMHHYWQWSDEGTTNALRYFQRAIESEPDYAPAHAGMVLAYITGSGWVQLWSPTNGVPKGKEIAQRAIQLDPTLADGYVAMGIARANFDWDWAGAEKDLKKALELNPNSSLALDAQGFTLYCRGRFDEAAALLKRALELDPLEAGLHNDLGVVYWGTGQLDRANTHFRRALELNPNFYAVRCCLAFSYQSAGRSAEAAAEFQTLAQSAPDLPYVLGSVGYFYGVTGRQEEARKVLAKLDELEQKRYVTQWARAMVYLGLGQKSAALDSLEKACEEHDGWMWSLNVDPWYDPLRSEPRFQALVKRVLNGGQNP